jgi:type IV secretion system protein VirB8
VLSGYIEEILLNIMKSRKDKQALIERERQLAANVAVDAATARNISLSTQAYLHAARWFEDNVAKGHQKKATTWRRLALFFGVLAFMAIAALMGVTPLKTVEPFLIRVDNNSGFTDVVRPISQTKTQDQIDDEFWLATYVRFRESYNFSSNDANFAMVELMSYDETFADYKNFQLSSKGYMDVLGTNRQIRTDVTNINPLPRANTKGGADNDQVKTYQVRLTKTVLDKNGVPDPQLKPTTWLNTVSFDYKKAPKKSGDQWLSPRGFGVRSYIPTQEVGVSHVK